VLHWDRSVLAALLAGLSIVMGSVGIASAEPTAPATTVTGSDLDERGLPSPREESLSERPPASTRWKVIGLGLGTAGLWYASGYGIRALWTQAPGADDLRIPVAGPFMDLSKTGCPDSHPNCSTFQLVLRTIMVSLDALGQVGGVAIATEGVFMPVASSSAPPSAKTIQRRPVAVGAYPWVEPVGGGGVVLVGRF